MELFDVARFDCIQSIVAAAITIYAAFETHRPRSLSYPLNDIKQQSNQQQSDTVQSPTPTADVQLTRIRDLDSLLIAIVSVRQLDDFNRSTVIFIGIRKSFKRESMARRMACTR
jgi:hypothetical protein